MEKQMTRAERQQFVDEMAKEFGWVSVFRAAAWGMADLKREKRHRGERRMAFVTKRADCLVYSEVVPGRSRVDVSEEEALKYLQVLSPKQLKALRGVARDYAAQTPEEVPIEQTPWGWQ
jgi:hypothetical protein